MKPLERVLLATDFSRATEHLVARVLHLPMGQAAELRVVHVMPPLPSSARGAAVKHARESLREIRAGLADATAANVVTEVAVGQPYVEIVRAARRRDAQLVMLGRHSKKGRRWELGTTAERVVRSGSTPVLVVQPEPARPYARPVVALDLSDTSRAVIDLARLVLGPRVPLRLVHAFHVSFQGFAAMSMSPREVRSLNDEYREGARRAMKELLDELGEDATGFRTAIRRGDPRTVLVRELVRRRADLAVLGTHGRTGLSHLLLGSVAEWVLKNAPCDVLIGRPERFTFELP